MANLTNGLTINPSTSHPYIHGNIKEDVAKKIIWLDTCASNNSEIRAHAVEWIDFCDSDMTGSNWSLTELKNAVNEWKDSDRDEAAHKLATNQGWLEDEKAGIHDDYIWWKALPG